MNIVCRYPSQKDACLHTGISEYKMLQSRKKNKAIDGYYYVFAEQVLPFHVETTCEQCGKTFMTTKSRVNKNKHNFCSRQCSSNYVKSNSVLNCQCFVCGKSFHKKPSSIKEHNMCSKECVRQFNKINFTGSNNHQYDKKGSLNSSWKSDERISIYGYRLIRNLQHPFANTDGFVFEHRLVAEQYLLNETNSVSINGQLYLSPEYVVHHLDFDKLNNSVDNLYVIQLKKHTAFHNSLNTLKRDEKGRIVKCTNLKDKYTTNELRNLFFEYIKNNRCDLSDTQRGSGGFGSTGK